MRKVLRIFASSMLCALFLFPACVHSMAAGEPSQAQAVTSEPVSEEPVYYEVPLSTALPEDPPEPPDRLSEEDIELLALITMAEAEGECEEGKRLVIDVVLNRMDSERFPDTVYEVIYQPGQFSPTWNGRLKRCEVREEICRLVREELESRTNDKVVFFTGGGYSAYGVPMFQVGGHYFSSDV